MKLAESEKSLFQTVHQRYADFFYFNKKSEAEAIAHYTEVSWV